VGVVVALGTDNRTVFDYPFGTAARLPACQVFAVEDSYESCFGLFIICGGLLAAEL